MTPDALPRLIAALQLPPFRNGARPRSAWYEDYLLANVRVFAEAGITAIKVQDETRERGPAAPETIARMAALVHACRREFPALTFGIIVQAHDPRAALAIADAVDASFVRLKVFVGAVVNSEGIREAIGVDAVDYRTALGRPDIRILADVHDRTSSPLTPVPDEQAALWAQGIGADALVITGNSFEETLQRIARAREVGVARPIVIGGSVDAGNIAQALAHAEAVIVSTSLRRRGAGENDLVKWDKDAAIRLVEAAGLP